MSSEAPKTAKEIAAEAIKVIEQKGWCQGKLQSRDGRVCLVGAINIAAYGSANPDDFGPTAQSCPELVLTLKNRLRRRLCYGNELLGDWNDNIGRTVDEVIAQLKVEAES